MKAAVYRGPRNIKIEDMPEPKPKREEALMRFKAGSICGTDLHYYRGEWRLKKGRIIGHDACGQLAETGEGVVIVPKIYCGHCYYCQRGKPNLCENDGFMGISRDGLFSEFIAAPKRNLLPIPDNVSFEEAGIVEPVALALHTFDLVQPRVGEWTTVIGQGPIGLLMTQAAKVSGCRVIAVDVEDHRLALSEKYGADVCINSKSENVSRKVKSLTHGGSDVVIEAAGRKETVEQTPRLARPTGRVALVGEFHGRIKFDAAAEATFFGVYLNPLKYPLALEMLSGKVLDVKGLITHRFSLGEFDKAIETALDPMQKPIKICLH
jgi:threonine dehydrogenase-like Zn-dependent dehydrogenase